ncbi:MAG: adenosylcobinamide-GDP ribazoletransferase [archaeon]|nr:adenosylcobinamide-GDP ribazoletransferase [archaeon]
MNNDNIDNKEKFSWIKGVLGLMSFSTILPIKVHTSISYMAKVTWVWPFIHLLIGALAAALGFILLNLLHFSSLFTAILIFAFLMIITGFNHMDGVMDMADGIMVHGSPRDKRMVMKDTMVGSAGIMAAILVSLATVGGLCNILDYNFILGVIVIEMLSKTSLLTTALVSNPSNKGIGRFVIESVNFLNFIISTVIVAIISYYVCGFVGIFALLGAVIGGGIVALVARNNFVLANGDVLGASNEFGRAMALLFMVIGIIFLM